ncbi:MAG: hypothetical protein DWQ47_04125 [Acidobacteria bacterium]|nr:MAG: hypothetical protein DWQ32_07675 [Acidobacteriota bacterium]REK01582.1 MAG: hypothetical protein DWQ38_04110 [Acidobacteriota bacterium]REK14538.1 MAG: hypothetical protein DWQ43_13365 [Acidobacteriota bacterium]REK45253.1 MAG: hypothetical protein DWQ47_04125 [Acidobacteriota bacterium]
MIELVKKLMNSRSPLLNGILALFVISGIVLGCTCNDKEGFQWGSNSGSESTDTSADEDGPDSDTKEKADASEKEIPGDEEMEEMIKNTLLDFDRAIKSEDFEDFHDNISEEWQKQTTPRQLKRLFQKFIDGKADVGKVRSLEPDISEGPEIKDFQGFDSLQVKGKFDTSPRETTFDLKYIANGKEWKLAAIEVYTGVNR